MNYEVTFDLILDIGRDLIRCGGEVRRVEDTLYRLALLKKEGRRWRIGSGVWTEM